jgi:beta-lactamase superfamily II metal-dependent hydrolase
MKQHFARSLAIMVLGVFIFASAMAQQELHIHHINVENGEATMIGIFDTGTQKYISKTLIDGGMSANTRYLVPYIKKTGNNGPDAIHFNYVILTHYHSDHYNGLNALKTAAITADSLVDPGGYDFHQYFLNQPRLAHANEQPYTSMEVVHQWTDMIRQANAHHAIKGRSEILVSYGTTAKTSLGHKLTLGKIENLPVTLECVAGWGNSLSANGIKPNPMPADTNANYFSLAFILQCGQFRYFIGGDLGGHTDTEYIDQETALTPCFQKEFPLAHSYGGTLTASGHICGFKANHHGSNNSNTDNFMDTFKPAIVVTSAGDKKGWFLPQVGYLNKLRQVQPLSVWTQHQAGTYNRGVYFTNLQDWNTSHLSLSTAKTLFQNQADISFDYGNDAPGHKASYLIRVKAEGLGSQSVFEVDRVDFSQPQPYTKLAQYFCHKQ